MYCEVCEEELTEHEVLHCGGLCEGCYDEVEQNEHDAALEDMGYDEEVTEEDADSFFREE